MAGQLKEDRWIERDCGETSVEVRDRPRERGQSLVEAMFMLILIISLVSVFGQLLFFELDVFNQSNAARYNFFHEAHKDQMSQGPTEFHVSVQGKPISQVVPFRVLFQPASAGVGNLKFGPRGYYGKKGSETWTPITVFRYGAIGVVTASLLLDLYEPTSGKIMGALSTVTGVFNAALDAL